jgi:hypothetical protein
MVIEYQGETHYYDISVFGSAEKRQQNDKIKQHACKQFGLTLISIPFWWDKSSESLAATIAWLRPGIYSLY